MDPRFLRLKKAVSSRPFLMFLFFVAILIVLTSLYVGLRDDGMAGTDVYWYVAIAIVAIIAIIFLLCAFICPSCMTTASVGAPEEPVSFHSNPERVSIGHDNYGANIQPELQNVESSAQPIIENPFRRIFGSAGHSSRDERSLPAPPGPGEWHPQNPQTWNPPRMWNTPPPTYREAMRRATSASCEPDSQTSSSRSLTFSLATAPSESENDSLHLAQCTPLPPDTTDAVQDLPNLAFVEPPPPPPSPSGAGNEDAGPVSRYSTPQASPETENNLNLNRAVSSSLSTHTASSTTTDSTWTSVSSLTSVSSERGRSGLDQSARQVIASNSPSYTGQSVGESITTMQRISAERHSGLTLLPQSTITPVNLRQCSGASLHPSDALSDHGSVENVEPSDNATPGPEEEEEESKAASHVASPVPNDEKEPVSYSDVTIDMEDDDDVETDLGLVLKLASSLLGAAWSSASRWVRPQQDPTTSVPTEASPASPPSTERRIVPSPESGNEEPTPEDPASANTRVEVAECTEPSQQGEDVVPPERRERP